MGPRGMPLIALVLMLVWRVTLGQLSRMRGFQSVYGASESPCGPGAPFQQTFHQQTQTFNRRPNTGFNPFGQNFNPYHAAMLDVDIPPTMFGAGLPFMGFPQAQSFFPTKSNSFSSSFSSQQPPSYARQQPPSYARQQPPSYARQQPPSYARQQPPSYARQQRPTYARTHSATYAQKPVYPSRSSSTFGRQSGTFPSSAGSSYPVHVSHRRVKRQIMMPRMNCQCDSATDCNMYATIAGRNYNSQCAGRLGLVCCCRGA